MKLYLCEKRREADAIAAVFGIRTLGAHAYSGEGRCLAWFFGEPSVAVDFHAEHPISPQLLGLKSLLDQADEVVIVDTGSSSRRDAAIVLDLLGYEGPVSTYQSAAAAQAVNQEHGALRQIAQEINGLFARDKSMNPRARKRTREGLNIAFRTLFQAAWHLSAVSEFNAVHVHVLLTHWEHLFMQQSEIAHRLDLIAWLATAQQLRHISTLIACARGVLQHPEVNPALAHSQVWLSCSRAFDATWLVREPAEVANHLVHTTPALRREKRIDHA